jgi:hypothetical protein|tara:strand:+ start:33 stop:221 length:189 start_codon:yes stop_codon:yes gene_type:complete
MSDRQQYLDRVRDLKKELKVILDKGGFVKEAERFLIQEAIFNLNVAEEHLNGYLQVDKYRGN